MKKKDLIIVVGVIIAVIIFYVIQNFCNKYVKDSIVNGIYNVAKSVDPILSGEYTTTYDIQRLKVDSVKKSKKIYEITFEQENGEKITTYTTDKNMAAYVENEIIYAYITRYIDKENKQIKVEVKKLEDGWFIEQDKWYFKKGDIIISNPKEEKKEYHIIQYNQVMTIIVDYDKLTEDEKVYERLKSLSVDSTIYSIEIDEKNDIVKFIQNIQSSEENNNYKLLDKKRDEKYQYYIIEEKNNSPEYYVILKEQNVYLRFKSNDPYIIYSFFHSLGN